jgi:hypothetical protein
MIKDPGATYSNLVDAQVRIHANAAPTTNSDGQMIGVHLQAPNLSALQVVEPLRADPFARPAIPIDRLLHREYFSTPFHRIHLRGNVTLQWPGSLLCIRDATRGICAQTTQTTPVAMGDLVDVAGFVETDNNAPVVTDAVFRSAGNNRPVASQPATADKILGGGFGSELIQIDGQLIGYDLASSDATLQLSSGDTLFPAILPKSLAGAPSSAPGRSGAGCASLASARSVRRCPEQCARGRGRDQVLPCPHALSGRRNHSGTTLLVDAGSCDSLLSLALTATLWLCWAGCHAQKTPRATGRSSPRE